MDTIHPVPVVALREGVVFPHTDPTLTFGRPKGVAALEAAFKTNRRVVFLAQKKPVATPQIEDLYTLGTLCTVETVFPGNGELHVVVKGISRVRVLEFNAADPYFTALVEEVPEEMNVTDKLLALSKQVASELKHAFDLGKQVDLPIFIKLMAGIQATELADQVANLLDLGTAPKQEILETLSTENRLDKVLSHLFHEIKILEMEHNISSQANAKYTKDVHEQMLKERRKAIEKELESMGSTDEDASEFGYLKKRLKEAKMPNEIYKKADKEFSRLSQMSSHNPEANYIRTYLEWLCDMPWAKTSSSRVSLKKAENVLNADHHGLKKVKERILEYLAVMKLKGSNSPTILCFAGPPGVGKTSLGRSIAKALGRKFVRVSLGGVRDEAEIRGHRRTYVGAMPGRIIQGVKNAGTKNPIFMLDEIDKLASDYRGDPSSALLEALDPEQNKEFSDHYLEVSFDLSQVMFIATANFLDTIPPALRDRLEVIEFSGYTTDEKQHIATDYLWPKQLKQHGLTDIKIPTDLLKEVIQRFTREAGVRDLERNLAKICRKIARLVAEHKKVGREVTAGQVAKFLGPHRFPETLAEQKNEVGMTTGMAWTAAGGDILFIEVAIMPGKGDLQLTGQLGDVMKESAKAAYSYVRSQWQRLGLKEDFYRKIDIHIHVPEGAVPKDGPSAGVTMATALVSALTKTPSRSDTAMTGEITLRGRVLEIGGVKEKVIAAHRAGIKRVLLPKENEKDLLDVPDTVKRDLQFKFMSHLDEVLENALASYTTPKSNIPRPVAIA